jgi:hypothetical protein
LIAIMLGRLRMSVEECITAYVKLMKRIFEKRENRSIMSVLGRVKPRFSADALSEAIAEVLRSRGYSTQEKFEEGDNPTCKVYANFIFKILIDLTDNMAASSVLVSKRRTLPLDCEAGHQHEVTIARPFSRLRLQLLLHQPTSPPHPSTAATLSTAQSVPTIPSSTSRKKLPTYGAKIPATLNHS